MASTWGISGNPEDSDDSTRGTSNRREDDVEWDGQVQPEPLHGFGNLASGQAGAFNQVDYGNFIYPGPHTDFVSADEFMQNMGPPLPFGNVLPNQYLQMNTTTDPYNAANSLGYAPFPASPDGGIWRDGPGTSTQAGIPEYSESPLQKRRRKKDVGGSGSYHVLIQQFINEPNRLLKNPAFAERLHQLLKETSGSGTTSGHAAGEDEQDTSGGQAEQLGMGQPRAGASEDAVATRIENLKVPKIVKDFLAHPELYLVDQSFIGQITFMAGRRAKCLGRGGYTGPVPEPFQSLMSSESNAFRYDRDKFKDFVLSLNYKNSHEKKSPAYRSKRDGFLMKIFERAPYPDKDNMRLIAKQLGDWTEEKVNRWFMQKRREERDHNEKVLFSDDA